MPKYRLPFEGNPIEIDVDLPPGYGIFAGKVETIQNDEGQELQSLQLKFSTPYGPKDGVGVMEPGQTWSGLARHMSLNLLIHCGYIVDRNLRRRLS